MHIPIVIDLDLAIVIAQDNKLFFAIGNMFHKRGNTQVWVQICRVLRFGDVNVTELVSDDDVFIKVQGQGLDLFGEVGFKLGYEGLGETVGGVVAFDGFADDDCQLVCRGCVVLGFGVWE